MVVDAVLHDEVRPDQAANRFAVPRRDGCREPHPPGFMGDIELPPEPEQGEAFFEQESVAEVWGSSAGSRLPRA